MSNDIIVVIDIADPKSSHALVRGGFDRDTWVKLGTQVELRIGKVSHNEIVIRIPAEDVDLSFVSHGTTIRPGR